MLTGAIEVYANHAVVIVGSTAWPEVDFGGGSAGADDRHVAIRTRSQAAHTRVSIWQNTMPLVGHLVFDGELDLDDYTICVGDIERIGRWTQRIDQTGVQRVIVRVDDPGNASRVNVGLGISEDAGVQVLPMNEGPALFKVLTSERESIAPSNALGLVLDGHDSPHARLSAAIMLLSGPDPRQAVARAVREGVHCPVAAAACYRTEPGQSGRHRDGAPATCARRSEHRVRRQRHLTRHRRAYSQGSSRRYHPTAARSPLTVMRPPLVYMSGCWPHPVGKILRLLIGRSAACISNARFVIISRRRSAVQVPAPVEGRAVRVRLQ